MKVISISFLVLAISTTIRAQDFRSGFVITNDGDSLTGFVANRSPKKNARECIFRTSKAGSATHYTPADIKSYGIVGYKRFQSKEISVDGKKQQLFIELLVQGGMSLLVTDGTFYLDKDSLLLLPKSVKEKVQEGTKIYAKIDQRYIEVLNRAIADCNLQANDVSYYEPSLVDLVIKYNACKGEPGSEIKANIPKNRITWSVLSGFDRGYSKGETKQSYSPEATRQFQVQKSVSVPVGLGFEWSSPQRNDKRFVGIELWYDKKFFQGYAESQTGGTSLRSDLFMDVSYVKTPIGIRLDLKNEKNTPYVRIGYTHYFVLSATARYRDEAQAGNVVDTSSGKMLMKKKSAEGAWLGVGYSLQLFRGLTSFVETRYEINTGLAYPGSARHYSGNALNLLLGVKF